MGRLGEILGHCYIPQKLGLGHASPLTTAARILSDDPNVSAILMMPTDYHPLLGPPSVTRIESGIKIGELQLMRQNTQI